MKSTNKLKWGPLTKLISIGGYIRTTISKHKVTSQYEMWFDFIGVAMSREGLQGRKNYDTACSNQANILEPSFGVISIIKFHQKPKFQWTKRRTRWCEIIRKKGVIVIQQNKLFTLYITNSMQKMFPSELLRNDYSGYQLEGKKIYHFC